jgi:hypothetical protein
MTVWLDERRIKDICLTGNTHKKEWVSLCIYLLYITMDKSALIVLVLVKISEIKIDHLLTNTK